MSTNNSSILPEFFDPITHDIMRDPVIGPDGHTYERSSIEEWFRHSTTSPITRQPMTSTQLIPNIALKNTIEQILAAQTASTSSTTTSVTAPFDKTSIGIDLDVKACKFNGETFVHAKVIPQLEGQRLPNGIVAVVDTSGSMGEEASVKNDTVEIVGFSRLDLVKHSLNTMVEVMNDNDVFAIVTFSSSAKVVLKPMKMNSMGKQIARTYISQLRPDANTNLWSGLQLGLEATKDTLFNDINKTVVILTDGASNQDPPRGIMPTFDSYIRTNNVDVNVHTFGYGYNLDATLLNQITDRSNGTYSYIPDCTMVGTVFINFLSYMLSTISSNNMLTITPSADTTVQQVFGYNSNEINLGNLQFGQSRDIIFKIKEGSTAPFVTISLSANGKTIEKQLTVINSDIDKDTIAEYGRLRFVECLRETLSSPVTTSYAMVNALYDEIAHLPVDDKLKQFLVDIRSDNDNEGQVSKAFSKAEWFTKWGRYYIPSIMRSNLLQYCNNFKDSSVQKYGGRLFKELQDYANDIFCKIDPPTPSLAARYQFNPAYNTPAYAPSALIAQISSSSIGCFDGNSMIEIADGTKVPVKNVQPGTMVYTPFGHAQVKVAIKIRVPNGKTDLVKVNDMLITPWHPIRANGTWVFPKEHSPDTYGTHDCDFVYNLVLDSIHIVNINGVGVCTLAHGFTGPVIEHDFFGTHKVLDDLKKMPGWSTGQIYIDNSRFTYDSNTGTVNGWVDDTTV
jgi:Mg-chelatase subunit ChlD